MYVLKCSALLVGVALAHKEKKSEEKSTGEGNEQATISTKGIPIDIGHIVDSDSIFPGLYPDVVWSGNPDPDKAHVSKWDAVAANLNNDGILDGAGITSGMPASVGYQLIHAGLGPREVYGEPSALGYYAAPYSSVGYPAATAPFAYTNLGVPFTFSNHMSYQRPSYLSTATLPLREPVSNEPLPEPDSQAPSSVPMNGDGLGLASAPFSGLPTTVYPLIANSYFPVTSAGYPADSSVHQNPPILSNWGNLGNGMSAFQTTSPRVNPTWIGDQSTRTGAPFAQIPTAALNAAFPFGADGTGSPASYGFDPNSASHPSFSNFGVSPYSMAYGMSPAYGYQHASRMAYNPFVVPAMTGHGQFYG